MKRDGRKFDHQTLEAIRLMAVERVRDGEAPSAVITSYGLCRTVSILHPLAFASSPRRNGASRYSEGRSITFPLNLYLVQGLSSTDIGIGATLVMAEISVETVKASATHGDRRQALLAASGLLGAVAASSCCVLPLVLFSLGVGGVWIGRLSALAPYQPIFIAITIALLGYGYWLVYRKPKAACAEGTACARPLPNRIVKLGLWVATGLVLLALAWPYILPLIIG